MRIVLLLILALHCTSLNPSGGMVQYLRRDDTSPMNAALLQCLVVERLSVVRQQGQDYSGESDSDLFNARRAQEGIVEHLMSSDTPSTSGISSILYPQMITTAENLVDKEGNNLLLPPISSQFFSDIDGRASYPLYGTPGGDMGEFINALCVYEIFSRPNGIGGDSINGLDLSFEVIYLLFQEYLEWRLQVGRDRFYYNTDEDAVLRWGVASDVRNPLRPQDDEEIVRLTNNVDNPDYIGCIHLKLALENPELYRIPSSVIRNAVRAFFSVYHDIHHPLRTMLLFEVLSGKHEETGIVYIDDVKVLNRACGEIEAAPLIIPKKSRSSLFIYHRGAVKSLRKEIAYFIAHNLNRLQDVESIFSALVQRGNYAAQVTLNKLNKPTFEVTVYTPAK
jgi:hypothetical protein